MGLVSDERKQIIRDKVKPLIGKSLVEIAKEHGVVYNESHLQDIAEGIAGLIMYNEEVGKFGIFIEKTDPPKRKRFTFAHELGHYFLHGEIIIESNKAFVDTEKIYTLFKRDDEFVNKDNRLLEAEANFFASELLMPEDAVRDAYKEVKNIEILSEIFMVSLQSMKFRLSNLGLMDGNHEEAR